MSKFEQQVMSKGAKFPKKRLYFQPYDKMV